MAKAEAQQEDPAALAARRVIEQQREREKRARERAALGGLWSRRDVFGRFGWSIFGGPGPRPLERLRITKAEDGQLLVDKGVKYLYEKGDWAKPGAFLKV